MFSSNAFTAPPRGEGVPILGPYNIAIQPPWRSVLPPAGATLRCGAGGVSIGRYGWANEFGFVHNVRGADTDMSGVVVDQVADWRRVFWDDITRSWKIREGFEVTLLNYCRTITVRLIDGGSRFARVYANPIDGTLSTGYADGLEETPWTLIDPCGPGVLAYITTWNPG